jgi:hypothetical protein
MYLCFSPEQVDACGRINGINGVTMALQMALLYALDLSILQRHEDGEGEIYYT